MKYLEENGEWRWSKCWKKEEAIHFERPSYCLPAWNVSLFAGVHICIGTEGPKEAGDQEDVYEAATTMKTSEQVTLMPTGHGLTVGGDFFQELRLTTSIP